MELERMCGMLWDWKGCGRMEEVGEQEVVEEEVMEYCRINELLEEERGREIVLCLRKT